MLEELSNVPPAIPLLLDEVLAKANGDVEKEMRRLKSLFPELKKQSRAYLVTGGLEHDQAGAGFDAYLDSGLDLFLGEGACIGAECRLAAASQFCRSFGLLADRVWLTDLLSEKFLIDGKPT